MFSTACLKDNEKGNIKGFICRKYVFIIISSAFAFPLLAFYKSLSKRKFVICVNDLN